MLTDRITLAPTAELEPEDYFSSALGVIFPDDITNQHGDPSTPVIYTSPTYGKICLSLADPIGENSRSLFAQYLWNAGVYIAVALEDAVVGPANGESLADQKEEDKRLRDKRKETDGDEPHSSVKALLNQQNNSPSSSSPSEPLTGNHTAPQMPATVATHKEKSPWDVQDEQVLELGAGTGLAGIIAAKAGAKHVLITDYPAPEVLANLEANVERNLSTDEKERCRIVGHEWGIVPKDDSADGNDDETAAATSQHQHPNPNPNQKYTRILVADCLWMPSQHQNLHRSIAYYLSPELPDTNTTNTTTTTTTTHHQTSGRALVVAGFHTGRAKMAPFFDERALAAAGLCVESIVERDAVGRERPWTWKGGGRGGEGGGGDDGVGEERERGDAEGRAGMSERKRWLVVAVLKKL